MNSMPSISASSGAICAGSECPTRWSKTPRRTRSWSCTGGSRDLEAGASAKGWLFGIALRVARDYRRRQKRKPTVSFDADAAPSSAANPFDDIAVAQAGRVLERFLATLDDDRRAVFVLSELEEMSAPEISTVLGTGVNTVYSRLRSARQRFVAFLADVGGCDG